MALTLTIAGVDVLDYLEPGPGNPGLDRALQARAVFRFVLKDRTGLYRPDFRQEVIATLDGVRIFGGVTTFIDEGDWGDYKGNWFTVEAGDWATVLDTTQFNGVAVGVTLKDVVQHLVTARLADRGFTVDPAMAAGPVINSQGYSFRYLTEIFDELGKVSGWTWTVDPFKKILFAPPATGRPGPFALTATNDTIHTIHTASSIDGYVNRVWLHYGAPGPREVTDTWHGDSSTKLFPTTFPQPEGVVSQPPTVLINGVTKPVANWGVDTGYDWYWRGSDAALIQDFALPALTPADTLIAVYVANFPGAVVESLPEITTYGEAALVETAPDVFDVAQAHQVAQGILRERGGLLRRITVVTHRPGLLPGHVITVTVPERALDEPCLVLSSRMIYAGRIADGSDVWRFELELVEGTVYSETWQKFFRDATATASGAAVSASGSVGLPPSGGGGGGSATPVPSSAFAQSLGGSRVAAGFVPTAAADAWIPIPDFEDAFVNFDDLAGTIQVSVQCRTHDPAVSVTPRVVRVDGSGIRAAVVATGAPTTATVWTYQSIPITGQTGLQPIRVELTTSVRNRDAFVANAMLDVF